MFLVEKAIKIASLSSNWAYQKLNRGEEFLVLEPATLTIEKKHLSKSEKKQIKSDKRKVLVSKAKKKVGTARQRITSPIGKLATVQAVAIAALFIYVSATRGGLPSSQGTKDVGQALQNTQAQRFLPSAAQYVVPKPFSESDVTTQQKLALYTWATPWNLDSLAATTDSYSSVSAFWATVQPDGINIQPKADWSIWQNYTSTAKKGDKSYYLTVSGDPDYTYLALSNPDVQTQHIAALLKTVQDQGFDGIDLDYEALGSTNRDLFTAFVTSLSSTFHAQHKLVAVTVEARLNNQVPMDWHTLGQVSDEVRVMVYDYHSQNTGTPGAIAPIGWLKEVLDYAQTAVDTHKLVVGLGNYGYDWTKSVDGTTTSWKGTGVSFEQALALATQYGAPVIRSVGIDERGYDIGSIPNFTYADATGQQHAVWFEDKSSLDLKLQLIQQYKPRGVIFWSVGLGDKAFWNDQKAAPIS